jgi:peptidoglycan/xylan/chitin deacetylase (PgdA/CDA1 family)
MTAAATLAAALTPLLQGRRRVAGLLIHSVTDKPGLSLTGISKNTFGEILGCLKNNNISAITLSQYAASQSLDVSTTAITFDDGFRSFYDGAYPMLEERGIKSTVFQVAGFIGKKGDWDVIGKKRHLTAAMLREVAGRGHEIGSHSLTHANLVWLNDADLIKELSESKLILEDITGTAVRGLSFPFGSWNRRVWDAAKSVGYEYATAYRGHRRAPPEFLPVFGVYRFDSATDAVARAVQPSSMLPLSMQSISVTTSRAFAALMSHFCKGTPLVKFRKEYRLFPQPAPRGRTSALRSGI